MCMQFSTMTHFIILTIVSFINVLYKSDFCYLKLINKVSVKLGLLPVDFKFIFFAQNRTYKIFHSAQIQFHFVPF